MNMATLKLSTVSLMLSIILWGTLLGGIAYSHLVYFPVYLSSLPDSAVIVNGPYGLNEGRFWGLIHPLLILFLLATIVLNWNQKARRKLIGLTVAIYVLAILATALYFVPELMAFANSPNLSVSPEEWLARGRRWQRLSWLRGFMMYVGYVPLLFALAVPVYDPKDSNSTAN
jgi:phosphoglycerol transferase MdoB-like AlkP superfamily enzyme